MLKTDNNSVEMGPGRGAEFHELGSDLAATAANKRALYAKSDGFYQIDAAGVISKLAGGASSELIEGAAPSTPSSGRRVIYAKTDGIYEKDDTGAELRLAEPTLMGRVEVGSGETADVLQITGLDLATDKVYDVFFNLTLDGDAATDVTIEVNGSAVSLGTVASMATAATDNETGRAQLVLSQLRDGTSTGLIFVESSDLAATKADAGAANITSIELQSSVSDNLGPNSWLEVHKRTR